MPAAAPDTIIADRLLEYYDPWFCLDVTPQDAATPHYPLVHEHQSYDLRDKDYHLGRITYFRDLLLDGAALDPIDIDNDWDLGCPIVVDGHHRLCAAILAKVPTIPAQYGGRVDFLRYLTGARKTKPEE